MVVVVVPLGLLAVSTWMLQGVARRWRSHGRRWDTAQLSGLAPVVLSACMTLGMTLV